MPIVKKSAREADFDGVSEDAKFKLTCTTSELYGKTQQVPQKETTPFYPRSPYAAAKLYSVLDHRKLSRSLRNARLKRDPVAIGSAGASARGSSAPPCPEVKRQREADTDENNAAGFSEDQSPPHHAHVAMDGDHRT